MRVVIDTNVLISALLFDGNPEKLVLATLAGSNQLVLSPYIIIETTRILETKFKVNPENLELLQQLLTESEQVYFEPFLHIITDEPDNRIVETAVKGRANYIVTGDKLLLALKQYVSIKIVSIKEYLEIAGI
jgi:putative PIN family toxin of toxin-antitoxin system